MAHPEAKGLNREDWAPVFLTLLAKTGSVREAYRGAKVTRQAAYLYRAESAEFKQKWDNAMEEGVEGLILEAHRRAMNGSDSLLKWLIQSYRGRVYKERIELDLRLIEQLSEQLGLNEDDVMAEVDSILSGQAYGD